MDLPMSLSPSSGMLLVLVSSIVFHFYTEFLKRYLPLPELVKQQKKNEVYYNIVTSLTHSTISSIVSLYCFYIDPNLASKIAGSQHSAVAYLILCVSLGYFIQDFIYFARRQSLFSNGGIVLHHVVVTCCFGFAVVQQHFVYYAIISLLCEVNSVFLHVRQLMKMAGLSKFSLFYRVNCLVNILTYVFFRICTLSWMCRWIVLHKGIIPDFAHALGTIGMALMTIINVILFARILSVDYWPRLRPSAKLPSMKTK